MGALVCWCYTRLSRCGWHKTLAVIYIEIINVDGVTFLWAHNYISYAIPVYIYKRKLLVRIDTRFLL